MASGAVPVDKLHDDPQVFAIRDIHPQAPVHFMVIPKEHIATAADLEDKHAPLLARMIAVGNDIARREGIAESGYRLVINMGRYLHIFHRHMHVLGGHRLGPEG
jgi:histidine triad (HIT) family protein